MRATVHRLGWFTDDPVAKLMLGLILVVSSTAEAYETYFDDLSHFRIRSHHVLFLFGFVNVLAAVSDLLEGLEKEIDIPEQRAMAAAKELVANEQQEERR